MCSGRQLQIWAAATGKARLPTVDSLTGGTTSRLVPAERSARRPGTSAVEVNGPRYCGASPWRTLYVSMATLNWIRSGTRSQCRLASSAVGTASIVSCQVEFGAKLISLVNCGTNREKWPELTLDWEATDRPYSAYYSSQCSDTGDGRLCSNLHAHTKQVLNSTIFLEILFKVCICISVFFTQPC